MKRFLRKSLSILVVIAMVIGSVSVAASAFNALPAVRPASVQADLNNLRAAYAAMEAAGAREQWTFTANPATDPATNPAAGYSTTITDLSPGGYVWRVAEAFEQLIQNDEFLLVGPGTGQDARDALPTEIFPFNWWANVYFDTAQYLFGPTRDARRSLLGAMTNMRRNSQPITSAGDATRSQNAFSKDARWTDTIGANLANTTTIVNRSEIIALRDVPDYAALLALPPAGVRTQMTFGMNAGNMIASGTQRFNYFSSRQTTTFVYSNTQINNLIAYHDHFFTGGTLGINPFVLSTGDLANLIADNTAALNAVSAFPTADLERFFGEQALEDVAEFIQACDDALNISDFLPHIQFFQDPGGFIDRIASGTYYDPADMTEMSGIWAGMEFHFQRLNGMSNAGRDQLTVLYGLDFPAIVAAREVLQRHMNLYELAALRVTIDANFAANWPGTIVFRPDAPVELGDIDGVDYFSDAWLATMVAYYNGFYVALNNYPTAHILEVFTDGIDHIMLFRHALVYETSFRQLESDLNSIFVFFLYYQSADLAAIGTNQLINILNEAIGFSNIFFDLYEEMADDLTPEDREFIFGNFPDIIPMVIHQMFLTLEGRFVAQVETALALYENVGEVSWENVALLRRMLGFIESPIFTRLVGTDYIPQHIRDAYLWLRGEILDEFQEFTRDGGWHSFETYEPSYPVRVPRTTDLARDTDFEVTDENLDSVADRLNAYLASDAFTDLTGIDLAEMIGEMIDGLWSDAVINMIIQVVYPELLGAFEQEWYNLPDYESDDDGMFVFINKAVMRTALGDPDPGNTFWHGNANNAGLRLYPDHLAVGLDGAGFTAAADALGSVTTSPSGSWDIYPTNAWSHSDITDADGNLNLRWGVDDPSDVSIPTWGTYSRQERFAQALSAAMGGLWPVLASLLAGQTYTGTVFHVARMHGFAVDTLLHSNPAYYAGTPPMPGQNMRSNVRAPRIYLDLNVFTGTHGYAELLTPIFEALMGEDAAGLALIPTMAQLEAITEPRDMVNAILNPILYFATERLPNAPLETILSVLPNIAFALTMDNISPLFRHLVLNLDYRADGTLHIRCVAGNGSNWNLTCGGTMGSQGMAIYDSIDLDLYEVFFGGDLDMSFLQDFNAILDMVAPLLGLEEGASLPLFNSGILATMGELIGPIPSNRPSGERFTIRANQGDVLLHLLRYVGEVLRDDNLFEFVSDLLGNDELIDGILTNIAEDTEDVIAALVELIAPNLSDHPLTPVEFNEPGPQGNPFPRWWAGHDPDGTDGEIKARHDAEFIVNNATIVIDVLWQALTGAEDPFTESIYELIHELLDPAELFELMADVFDVLLEVLDDMGLVDLLEDLEDLLEMFVLIDGDPLPLAQMLDDLETFLDPANISALAATIDDFRDFTLAMSALLAPIAPILDFLLFGANLELVNIYNLVEVSPGVYERDSVGSLITIRGYEGFAYGLAPIFNAFMLPLGLPPVTVPTLADSAQDKVHAILGPIVDIAYALLESDDLFVDVLTLLPNLIHFISPDADGGYSPLQQSVDRLLHPVYVLLDTLRPIIDVTDTAFGEFRLNGLVLMEDVIFFTEIGSESPGGRLIVDPLRLLNDLVATIPLGGEDFEVDLRFLMQGALVNNSDGYFFEADVPAVFFALLAQIGLFDEIERMGWIGLTRLIQYGRFEGPARINYAFAPTPVSPISAMSNAAWMIPYADFLADNLEAVIDWAYAALLADNPVAEQEISDLLGFHLPLAGTLEETIANLWSDELFVLPNLETLAGLAYGLRDTLMDIEIPVITDFFGANLIDLLADLVSVYCEHNGVIALDLDEMLFDTLSDFLDDPDAFVAPFAGLNGEEWFFAILGELFGDVMPLLRVFLAESNLLLIQHDDIAHTGPYLGTLPDDGAFLRVFGYDGWQTAMLPIFLGLGAAVPGFATPDVLMRYDDFRVATQEEQLQAIFTPILFLLNALAENPATTLMQVIPNVAFFIGDGGPGPSLLQQAIDRLLWPLNVILQETNVPELQELMPEIITNINAGTLVSDLIGFPVDRLAVGTARPFSFLMNPAAFLLELDALGLSDPYGPGGLFVAVDMVALLIQALYLFGLTDDLGDIFGLLNIPGRVRTTLTPLNYPQVRTLSGRDLYSTIFWRQSCAIRMICEMTTLIENIMPLIFGTSIEELIRDLLGEELFTQENFEAIVELLQDLLDLDIDLNMNILGRSLAELIRSALTVDGVPFDLVAMLNAITSYNPTNVNITGQDSFIENLINFLEPLGPILNMTLFGADITLLDDLADINGGDGLATIFGQEGYRLGLIPILEALLLPLGIDDQITSASAMLTMTNRQRLEAIVAPVLYLLEVIVEDPVDSVLLLLPNLAYFLTAGLLDDALENTLYGLNDLLAAIPGVDPIELNVEELLDDLISDLGFVNLNVQTLRGLLVGQVINYTSLSGHQAIHLAVLCERDRADLLTALLRTLIGVIQSDPINRDILITLLVDAIAPGNLLLRWTLQFTFWVHRVLGANITLFSLFTLVRFVNFFWTPIQWMGSLFGVF